MPEHPSVSVNIVVRNGARYIRHCLDAVRAQTYAGISAVVLDNASTDGTPDIVAREYPECRLIRHSENVGMWPGQELLLAVTRSTYVLSLSVDVVLAPDFVRHAVAACTGDPAVGAVQGKLYQYDIDDLYRDGPSSLRHGRIDTCGFAMTRARKVLNIRHGESDDAWTSAPHELFGVEGAVPFFRRSALEDCRIGGRIWDPDFFWYGDDLDLAWRMHVFGHRQVFVPDAIAWHDRSTTKGVASDIAGHLSRIAVRRRIPLTKRRLDWSNVRFTIIKNDYIMNILRDLPWILGREIATFAYTVFFEPRAFAEAGRFVRMLPRMLRRRRLVMQRAVIGTSEFHRWFI